MDINRRLAVGSPANMPSVRQQPLWSKAGDGVEAVKDEGSATISDAVDQMMEIGSYGAEVRLVDDAAGEIMLLWALQQPTLSRPNAFVRHSSLELRLDACGHQITVFQTPSSMSNTGVTGAVMWDSGVVLGKFLENAVDSGSLVLQGKKVIELGSGCGLVGCMAALLGAQVILTDLPDRLRLLRKNVEINVKGRNARGSAEVHELTWGDDPDCGITEPLPDFILGSDVIYGEAAVADLISTLRQLCGSCTTIFLAGELRNDAVLENFLEAALDYFVVGHIDQIQWHPDYHSQRVAVFILVKRADN